MKGYCQACHDQQAQGIADYTCVLCTLALTGTEPCVSHTPEGTTVIDLAKLFEEKR